MKTFAELTKLALAAHESNTARADFLASVSPEDRSDAAMQFDRAARLETERTTPAPEQEINAEARRIAVTGRLAEYCRENQTAYGDKLIGYILTGRMMSAGMQREAATARAYAEQVTPDEIAAAREQAIENLNVNRNHLAARLGVPA